MHTQPLFSASSLVLSGPLAIARQASAPPQQRSIQLTVTRHTLVVVDATVKGAKPLPKLYTDLQLSADDVNVCWSPGLDPILTTVCVFVCGGGCVCVCLCVDGNV